MRKEEMLCMPLSRKEREKGFLSLLSSLKYTNYKTFRGFHSLFFHFIFFLFGCWVSQKRHLLSIQGQLTCNFPQSLSQRKPILRKRVTTFPWLPVRSVFSLLWRLHGKKRHLIWWFFHPVNEHWAALEQGFSFIANKFCRLHISILFTQGVIQPHHGQR